MSKPFKGFGPPPPPPREKYPRFVPDHTPAYLDPAYLEKCRVRLTNQNSFKLPKDFPNEETIFEKSTWFISAIALKDAYHLERAATRCFNKHGLKGMLLILGMALAQLQDEDITWFCQQKSEVIPKTLFDPKEIADLRKSVPMPKV